MKRTMAAVLSSFALCTPHGVRSEETGAAFLKINPSVQGEALGGLNPVASHGAQAMGVNPANMRTTDRYEFTSGFATMIGDSSYGTAGLAIRKSEGLTVGGHVTFLQSGSLEGRDASGNVTRNFSARDMAGGISAAMGGENFSVGITAKAVRQEIGDLKSNTAGAGDVGLAMKTGNISWGAAALNLGGKLKFRGQEEALPAIYSLGASLPLGGGLTGLAGASQVAGETVASMGLEYNLNTVSLRAGYRSEGGENLAKSSQKSTDQALGGLTGGIGVTVSNWRLDYAVSQTAVEYGMSHRAAVTFKWGGEEFEETRAHPARKPAAKAAPAKKPSSDGVSTGSRRAYDPAPIKKAPKKKKKTWVF